MMESLLRRGVYAAGLTGAAILRGVAQSGSMYSCERWGWFEGR